MTGRFQRRPTFAKEKRRFPLRAAIESTWAVEARPTPTVRSGYRVGYGHPPTIRFREEEKT
jgi:hypothetical protein